jgi:hypothetical protein
MDDPFNVKVKPSFEWIKENCRKCEHYGIGYYHKYSDI